MDVRNRFIKINIAKKYFILAICGRSSSLDDTETERFKSFKKIDIPPKNKKCFFPSYFMIV